MTGQIYDLLREAAKILVYLLVPLFAATVFSGLVVGVLQAATAIRERALSYAIKMISVVGVLYFLFPLFSDRLIKLFTISLQGQ